MEWLGAELSRLPSLKIVAGDFNLTPWSFSLAHFERQASVVRHSGILGTWSVERRYFVPLFPIDHVFSSPEIRLASIMRGPRLDSDHLPVVATLLLP